jgi:large subunit ribosomal protein L24
MKIKKGDTVLVIRGKDRGKTGKVLKALPKENRIIVEGLNLAKKHVRPRKTGEKGEIVQIPMPIYVSNVKLICPKCKKATKVGYAFLEGRKLRKCKKCQEVFE